MAARKSNRTESRSVWMRPGLRPSSPPLLRPPPRWRATWKAPQQRIPALALWWRTTTSRKAPTSPLPRPSRRTLTSRRMLRNRKAQTSRRALRNRKRPTGRRALRNRKAPTSRRAPRNRKAPTSMKAPGNSPSRQPRLLPTTGRKAPGSRPSPCRQPRPRPRRPLPRRTIRETAFGATPLR